MRRSNFSSNTASISTHLMLTAKVFCTMLQDAALPTSFNMQLITAPGWIERTNRAAFHWILRKGPEEAEDEAAAERVVDVAVVGVVTRRRRLYFAT